MPTSPFQGPQRLARIPTTQTRGDSGVVTTFGWLSAVDYWNSQHERPMHPSCGWMHPCRFFALRFCTI